MKWSPKFGGKGTSVDDDPHPDLAIKESTNLVLSIASEAEAPWEPQKWSHMFRNGRSQNLWFPYVRRLGMFGWFGVQPVVDSGTSLLRSLIDIVL